MILTWTTLPPCPACRAAVTGWQGPVGHADPGTSRVQALPCGDWVRPEDLGMVKIEARLQSVVIGSAA